MVLASILREWKYRREQTEAVMCYQGANTNHKDWVRDSEEVIVAGGEQTPQEARGGGL